MKYELSFQNGSRKIVRKVVDASNARDAEDQAPLVCPEGHRLVDICRKTGASLAGVAGGKDNSWD